jgi:predicted alpha/beta-fold hydrolase
LVKIPINKNNKVSNKLILSIPVFGVSSEQEYIRKTAEYKLDESHIHKITTPTLILEGENDKVFHGQANKLAAELKCPHKHVVMRSADGGGEHCHMGAMRLLHQTIFDWLEKTLIER